MHYADCYNWPFQPFAGILQAILWVVFVVIIINIFKRSRNGSLMSWRSWRGDSAEDLLKERYVKGEISKEEYEEKLGVIRNSGAGNQKKG